MSRPELNKFTPVGITLPQKYERYLPTAFDGSLTMLEKINMVIQTLNEVGQLTNGVVELWNEVMVWIMADGLQDSVNDKLEEMYQDGSLAQIINVQMIGSLQDLETDFTGNLVGAINEANKSAKGLITVSEVEPEQADEDTYWYQDKGEPPINFSVGGGVEVGNATTSSTEPIDKDLWFKEL